MDTKTITLESTVYRRLAASKRDGDSFSDVIDRVLHDVEDAHTGRGILRRLSDFSRLTEGDAGQFLAIVAENRRGGHSA